MTTQQQQRLIDALEALGEAVEEIADTIRDEMPAGIAVPTQVGERVLPRLGDGILPQAGEYIMPRVVFIGKDAPDCEGTWLGQTQSGEWDALTVIRESGEESPLVIYVPGAQRPAANTRWQRFVGPLPDPRRA